MIYEKEFNRVKEVYQQLSPAAREIAGLMALLPVACVALYGGVLGALGMMGFGSVALLGITTTAVAAAGIACTVDLERELRPWLQQQKGRADARVLETGIALKKRAARYMAEKFSANFATAAIPAQPSGEQAAQVSSVRVQLSGGAFNPVALRLLNVANNDVARKPAAKTPAKAIKSKGGAGK